jgi:hypothetical protein
MANTYELISSTVLTSTATVITFSSIPATYNDLVIRASYRISASGNFGGNPSIRFNADSSAVYSNTQIDIYGTSSSTSSNTGATSGVLQSSTSAGNTANVFTSTEIYIPNYRGTTDRPYSVFKSAEQFATSAELHPVATLYRGSAAITSITLQGVTFIVDSKFYLYGIKNS